MSQRPGPGGVSMCRLRWVSAGPWSSFRGAAPVRAVATVAEAGGRKGRGGADRTHVLGQGGHGDRTGNTEERVLLRGVERGTVG